MEKVFKVQKGVTEITFEGDLIEGGAIVQSFLLPSYPWYKQSCHKGKETSYKILFHPYHVPNLQLGSKDHQRIQE